MNKNAKILVILLVAVVMAVLAGFAVVSFLSPRRATIYVFKSAYSIGTQITSDMLVPVQVDSAMTAAGRSANVNEKFITSDDLRAILESLLLDVMFETPSQKDLEKCVITKAVAEQQEKPLLITRTEEEKPAEAPTIESA